MCAKSLNAVALLVMIGCHSECNQTERLDDLRAARITADSLLATADWCVVDDRPYGTDLVRSLGNFYRFGSGTARSPGCEVVTRKYCREFGLGLYYQMVQHGQFTPEALTLLRAELSRMSDQAATELSREQRGKLEYLLSAAETLP
jgi:hypothetical protein